MILKIPQKTLNDYFSLQDFQDDFVTISNTIEETNTKVLLKADKSYVDSLTTANINDTPNRRYTSDTEKQEINNKFKKIALFVEEFYTPGMKDGEMINKAINYCFNNNISHLHLERNKVYTLDDTGVNTNIVLYGKNLTLHGNGATIKKVNTSVGNFGDVIDIYGLFPTYTYPNYGLHSGSVTPAENIIVEDLTVEFDNSLTFSYINGFGICVAKNCYVRNVTVKNANQTAFAVVGDRVNNNLQVVDNITLENCISINSKKHAYRLSSIGTGNNVKIKMLNCKAYSSGGKDTSMSGKDRNIHLWVHLSQPENCDMKIDVRDCFFDSTGEVFIDGYAQNVNIDGCVIERGICAINDTYNDGVFNKIIINNNKITAKENTADNCPLFIRGMNDITITNNLLPTILPTGSLYHNVVMYQSSDVTIENNNGLSFKSSINIVRKNRSLVIRNNKFRTNNILPDTEATLDINHVDRCVISENVFYRGFIMAPYKNGVRELIFDSNKLYLELNTRDALIAQGGVDSKGFIVTNNIIQYYATAPMRTWLPNKTDNIVRNNIKLNGAGDVFADGGYVSAIPTVTSGYYDVGDIVHLTSPTSGGYVSYILTSNAGWKGVGTIQA